MDLEAKKAAAKIGESLDYDKSATFGSSNHLYAVREFMISASGLSRKVANFKTRSEAVDWLMSRH